MDKELPKVHHVFTIFQLEEEDTDYGLGCYYDTVEINDGGFSNATEIGTFCGNIIPDDIISTGNKLHIEFNTDDLDNFPGFFSSFTKGNIILMN